MSQNSADPTHFHIAIALPLSNETKAAIETALKATIAAELAKIDLSPTITPIGEAERLKFVGVAESLRPAGWPWPWPWLGLFIE